jgi:hypothetical protein
MILYHIYISLSFDYLLVIKLYDKQIFDRINFVLDWFIFNKVYISIERPCIVARYQLK